jgi:aconitate hydratase
MSSANSFGTSTQCTLAGESVEIFSLSKLEQVFPNVATLPYSLKILLENLLRHEDARFVQRKDIEALAGWKPGAQLQ